MLPRYYYGKQLPLPDLAKQVEAIACADSSVGWVWLCVRVRAGLGGT